MWDIGVYGHSWIKCTLELVVADEGLARDALAVHGQMVKCGAVLICAHLACEGVKWQVGVSRWAVMMVPILVVCREPSIHYLYACMSEHYTLVFYSRPRTPSTYAVVERGSPGRFSGE